MLDLLEALNEPALAKSPSQATPLLPSSPFAKVSAFPAARVALLPDADMTFRYVLGGESSARTISIPDGTTFRAVLRLLETEHDRLDLAAVEDDQGNRCFPGDAIRRTDLTYSVRIEVTSLIGVSEKERRPTAGPPKRGGIRRSGSAVRPRMPKLAQHAPAPPAEVETRAPDPAPPELVTRRRWDEGGGLSGLLETMPRQRPRQPQPSSFPPEPVAPPEPAVAPRRFRGFASEATDVFRCAFVSSVDRVPECEALAERALAMKTAPAMDFIVRDSTEDLPARIDAVIMIGPPTALRGAKPPFVVHFDGDLEVAIAGAYSTVHGSPTAYRFNESSGELRVKVAAPKGLSVWNQPAKNAERLFIAKECAVIGGFFGPLLKRIRILDLTKASPKVQIAPQAFRGFNFEQILVSGLKVTPRQFCANFLDAFDLFGSPWGVTVLPGSTMKDAARPKKAYGVRGLKFCGSVAWAHWEMRTEISREFEELEVLDMSETDWTTVGPESFEGFTFLKELVLPAKATKISGSAMKGCDGLTTCVIPSTITEIGEAAFENCTRLAQLDIPKSTTKIRAGAFKGCAALVRIVFPHGTTQIAANTLDGCSSLAELIIPEGVTMIGECAIAGCRSLATLVIPNSVTEIGKSAFVGCSLLRELVIPAGIQAIGDSAFDWVRIANTLELKGPVISDAVLQRLKDHIGPDAQVIGTELAGQNFGNVVITAEPGGHRPRRLTY